MATILMKGVKPMSNAIVLWHSPNGIQIETTDFHDMISYADSLSTTEITKVQRAIHANLYDMAAEYIWVRATTQLRSMLIQFGEEFVLEMLGREKTPEFRIDDISIVEVINLATDLGFINRMAQKKLIHYVDVINLIMERNSTFELDAMDSQNLIKDCIKFILGHPSDNSGVKFDTFRDRLYKTSQALSDSEIEELISSPYFYKRTIARTLLNLIRTKEGGELDNSLSNFDTIIPVIWEGLLSEDKYPFGNAYAYYVNSGDKRRALFLKSVLSRVKGFDFVPETLRSNTFIEAAKELLKVHYEFNNFYNEAGVAKKLESLGTIPRNAIGQCMTAVIACKLGNYYGIAGSAQPYLNRILGTLSPIKWQYYFDEVFPNDMDVLAKLSSSSPREHFAQLISDYNLTSLTFKNPTVERLVKHFNDHQFDKAKRLVDDFMNGKIQLK